MRFLITRNEHGGEAWLTNEHPDCRYGLPVLDIAADDILGVFGPADLIGEPPTLMMGAAIVAAWAADEERTPEEISLARGFCGQWPEGPQVETEDEGASLKV